MVRRETKVFEAQIRDTAQHYSTDDPSGDDQFTVATDTLHPHTLDSYERIAVYVDDTHDNTFDTTIQSTTEADRDWTAGIDETTLTGGTNAKASIDGPVGRLRLAFGAPGTAPTDGRIRVTVLCLGQE